MDRFLDKNDIPNLPYTKAELTFLQIPNCRMDFVQSVAEYFIRQWMFSGLPDMMDVWKNWNTATDAKKEIYRMYLDAALFSDDPNDKTKRLLVDAPNDGNTTPIGVFTETMLRLFTESFGAQPPLLVEPSVPQPTGSGQVDFIEIKGVAHDINSMTVQMWESKGSDGQVSAHHSKIYRQLDDYSRRLFYIANNMCASYSDNRSQVRNFLRLVALLAKNKDPKVHYGVFVTYDSRVAQNSALVNQVHTHPPGHPSVGGGCHHLVLLLIPDFKTLRMDVWKAMHLA